LGSLFSFVLGIGLYGLTYLYPVYLGQVRGYEALMIGETMFVSGVFMFLTAPVAGRLSTTVDPRLMLIAGFLSFAAGTYWMTWLTKDWDFWELFWPQVFRGVGLMMAMIPINNVALGTLPLERVKNASGLFNLTRNLGGAVGLAALTTLLNDRTDLHLTHMLAHRQRVVMAFADVFLALTVLFVGLAFFALVMKRPAQSVAGGH
jgi:DHA2 family multidrug resistance protein